MTGTTLEIAPVPTPGTARHTDSLPLSTMPGLARSFLGEYEFRGDEYPLWIIYSGKAISHGGVGGPDGRRQSLSGSPRARRGSSALQPDASWYMSTCDVARLFAESDTLNPLVLEDRRVRALLAEDPVSRVPCIERAMLAELGEAWGFPSMRELSRMSLGAMLSAPGAAHCSDASAESRAAASILSSLHVKLVAQPHSATAVPKHRALQTPLHRHHSHQHPQQPHSSDPAGPHHPPPHAQYLSAQANGRARSLSQPWPHHGQQAMTPPTTAPTPTASNSHGVPPSPSYHQQSHQGHAPLHANQHGIPASSSRAGQQPQYHGQQPSPAQNASFGQQMHTPPGSGGATGFEYGVDGRNRSRSVSMSEHQHARKRARTEGGEMAPAHLQQSAHTKQPNTPGPQSGRPEWESAQSYEAARRLSVGQAALNLPSETQMQIQKLREQQQSIIAGMSGSAVAGGPTSPYPPGMTQRGHPGQQGSQQYGHPEQQASQGQRLQPHQQYVQHPQGPPQGHPQTHPHHHHQQQPHRQAMPQDQRQIAQQHQQERAPPPEGNLPRSALSAPHLRDSSASQNNGNVGSAIRSPATSKNPRGLTINPAPPPGMGMPAATATAPLTVSTGMSPATATYVPATPNTAATGTMPKTPRTLPKSKGALRIGPVGPEASVYRPPMSANASTPSIPTPSAQNQWSGPMQPPNSSRRPSAVSLSSNPSMPQHSQGQQPHPPPSAHTPGPPMSAHAPFLPPREAFMTMMLGLYDSVAHQGSMPVEFGALSGIGTTESLNTIMQTVRRLEERMITVERQLGSVLAGATNSPNGHLAVTSPSIPRPPSAHGSRSSSMSSGNAPSMPVRPATPSRHLPNGKEMTPAAIAEHTNQQRHEQQSMSPSPKEIAPSAAPASEAVVSTPATPEPSVDPAASIKPEALPSAALSGK